MSPKPDLWQVVDRATVQPLTLSVFREHSDHLLIDYYKVARRFLVRMNWCVKITHAYLGLFFPSYVAVFLVEYEDRDDQPDPFTWIIVGEVPPLYVTVDESPNPACALDSYLGALSAWSDAFTAGEPMSDVCPIYASHGETLLEVNQSTADMVGRRYRLLDKYLSENWSHLLSDETSG